MVAHSELVHGYPTSSADILASSDAGTEEDRAEMVRLLAGCARVRVRHELQAWLDARPSTKEQIAGIKVAGSSSDVQELEADLAEMEDLLRGSRRAAPLRRALRPWMDDVEQRLRKLHTIGLPDVKASPSSSQPESANQDGAASLPTLTIVGSRGTGKRALLQALIGSEQSQQVAGGEESLTTFETKYYAARVNLRCLDVEEHSAQSVANELVASAEGVVALWDASRPCTFAAVSRLLEAALNLNDDDEGCGGAEGPDRVQICVAAKGLSSGADAVNEASLDEARTWCAMRGFEYLCCGLGNDDLELVRGRLQRGRAGEYGGLLEQDTDESAERIAEALECHAWSGMERRQQKQTAPTPATPVPTVRGETGSRPLLALIVVGDGAVAPAAGLIDALALAEEASSSASAASVGAAPLSCAGLTIETKYYTAQIRVQCFVDQALTGGEDDIAGAEGTIIVYDPLQPDAVARVQRAQVLAQRDAGGMGLLQRVRLCIATCAESNGSVETMCADRGFEFIQCALGPTELEAVRRLRRGEGRTGAGAPLLAEAAQSDGAASEATSRIVEALECHMWPGLERKTPARPVAASPPVAVSSSATPARKEQGESAGVETLDKYADEMKQVRAIGDHGERRERAAELALRLAGALGLDEEDDDE